MDSNKLNYLEASFLIIIVMITHIILNFPNVILESVGSASVLNVIYITILALVFFLIIEKLSRPFESGNILNIAEFVGGKTLKVITSIIFSVYFIIASGNIMRSFSEALKVIYFSKATLWSILTIFIIVAIIANKFGSRNLIRTNALFMPIVLFSAFVIFFSAADKFEFNRIYPILGYGFNSTFISGSLNIYAFSGLIYLYLIKPNLKNVNEYKKVGIISIIVSGLYLLLSVSSILMLFPFLPSSSEGLSVYLSTRTIQFGEFFQRVDALFIFMWIFAFLSYLSVVILCIVKINTESIRFNNRTPIMFISGILIFIIALFPENSIQIRFLEVNLYKYLALGIVYVYSFLIIFIGFLKKRKNYRYISEEINSNKQISNKT